jgi:cysteine sulfinate desulfinase/cysteine desulfurase-like protein
MGVPRDIAFGALRVSFGWQTTTEEISSFLEQVQQVLKDY